MSKEIDVFIEISKNSSIKYEYDTKTKTLRCDRILHTPFKYFFNYGFIPNTISGDGDPLDVVVLMEDELVPGCHIKCKILGSLDTSDDDGYDPKIIACPVGKIAPEYKELNELEQLSSHSLKKIKYFFTHYKDLENKKVSINGFLNREKSIEIYEKSKKDFQHLRANDSSIFICETLDTM
jgi:inorganic pyrophosphatase